MSQTQLIVGAAVGIGAYAIGYATCYFQHYRAVPQEDS